MSDNNTTSFNALTGMSMIPILPEYYKTVKNHSYCHVCIMERRINHQYTLSIRE